MDFQEELARVLPEDVPHRQKLIELGARHLDLIVEANQYLNLTRITTPREAAIKHVLDSILPWRLFAHARHVLDAGTGAGFPGIPLAIILPDTRFTLAESIQKKARFVESAVEALDLRNTDVSAQRAEELLRTHRVDLITARAVAPISRAVPLFAAAIKAGARVLLYKGPDIDAEIAESAGDARRHKIQIRVLERYDLPDALGTRTIVELSR